MIHKKKRRKPPKKDETIREVYAKALDRLAAEYGIEPGDCLNLLLQVAIDYVPGFPRFKLEHIDDAGRAYGKIMRDKGGRKADWTPEKLDELVADVDRVKKEHRFVTDDEALRHLAQSGKWARDPDHDPRKRHKTLKNTLARARLIQRQTDRLLAKADRLLAKLSSNPEN